MFKKLKTFVTALLGHGQEGQLARGSALLLVAKVLGALSGYVMAFLLTKRGGADAVGVYELSFTCIMLLSVVSRFGLDGAMVRYIGVFGAQNQAGAAKWLYKKSMIFALVFASVLGAGVYVLAPVLSSVFGDYEGDDSLIDPFRWAAVAMVFFTLLNMNGETLRGYKKMLAYSFFQQGSVVLLAVALLWFVLVGADAGLHGVQAFLLASVVLLVVSQLNVLGVFKSVAPAQIPTSTTFSEVKKVAWPIFLSSSIFMVMSWTDTLMIGYFLNKADVGVYRIAFKISTVITFTQFAVNGIAAPMIAEHYHNNDMRGLRALIHKIGVFNFLLSVPIFLIILVAPTALLQLFGAEYISGRLVLLTLAFGQVVFALSGPVLYILTMTKHEKSALRIMYVTAAINLVGNAVLIPLFGLQGAAMATAFTTLLWNVLAVIAVFRFLGIISVPFIHSFFERPLGN